MLSEFSIIMLNQLQMLVLKSKLDMKGVCVGRRNHYELFDLTNSEAQDVHGIGIIFEY